MAILSSPMASVRSQTLISLDHATPVPVAIEITSVTPATQETPASLILSGSGQGYFVQNDGGESRIILRPTVTQHYPIVYTLTLTPPPGFSFAQPLGQLSLVGEEDGFLLESPILQLYQDDMTLTQEYNLALQFLDQANNNQVIQVDDPTIVFEPPS